MSDFEEQVAIPHPEFSAWWVTRGSGGRLYAVRFKPNARSRVQGPFSTKATAEAWIWRYERKQAVRSVWLVIGLCGLVGTLVAWVLL